MRLISFALTEPQFVDGTKDVTRRLGWKFLKVGQRLQAVRKAMGLKRGEHPKKLGVIEVVKVSREPLNHIDTYECRREGFPNLSPLGFIEFFCEHMRVKPETVVTRIEFRRVA